MPNKENRAMNTKFDASKYCKGKWLHGADLSENEQTVATINAAYEHTFEESGDTRPAIEFLELDQILLLNKTQTRTMIKLFGTNAGNWIGKRIAMFPVPTQSEGKPTIAIRAPSNGEVPELHQEVVFKK